MKNDFFLIGDSNSADIAQAAITLGYNFQGGTIGPGFLFDKNFYSIEGDDFKLELSGYPISTGGFDAILRTDLPILSTIGFNSQRIGQLVNRELRMNRLDALKLSQAVLEAIVEGWKAPAIAFYESLKKHGREVWFTHSPQRFPELYFEVAIRLESILQRRLIDLGIGFIDVRASTTDADGRLLKSLCSYLPNDNTHANEQWGAIVMKEFVIKANLVRPNGGA